MERNEAATELQRAVANTWELAERKRQEQTDSLHAAQIAYLTSETEARVTHVAHDTERVAMDRERLEIDRRNAQRNEEYQAIWREQVAKQTAAFERIASALEALAGEERGDE